MRTAPHHAKDRAGGVISHVVTFCRRCFAYGPCWFVNGVPMCEACRRRRLGPNAGEQLELVPRASAEPDLTPTRWRGDEEEIAC